MIFDIFLFALRDIGRKTIRTNLTVLGIVIGIMAIVSLLSISSGLKKSIESSFRDLGSDKIVVSAGIGDLGINSNALTVSDARYISSLKGVSEVGYLFHTFLPVSFSGEEKIVSIFCVSLDEGKNVFTDIKEYNLLAGRHLKKTDRFTAIIGYKLWKDFFGKSVGLHNRIKIANKTFRVVGILKRKGSPRQDSRVIINYRTASKLFGLNNRISVMMIKSKPGTDIDKLAEKIKDKLKKRKGEDNFIVETTEDILKIANKVLGVIQYLILSIAFISLLVGGIGITNTMYTSVIEKTKDIGIMKSIGAKNSDIMLIFLFESGVIGLIGGVIGVILGIFIAGIISHVAEQAGYSALKAEASGTLIISTIIFSFLVGSISGVLPARNAALKKPVDALRSR